MWNDGPGGTQIQEARVGCYLDWLGKALGEAASGFPEQNIYSVLQSAQTVFVSSDQLVTSVPSNI